MLIHGLERLVQVAAMLTGGNGLHKRGGQDLLAALGKARRDGAARLHILRHLDKHLVQGLVAGLSRDEVHRARDGDARAEDDGKLAAHDDERLAVEPVAADLHVQQAFPLALDGGHPDDDIVVLLDAVDRVHLVERFHHAGNLLPGMGHGDIFIGYQGLSLPLQCCVGGPLPHFVTPPLSGRAITSRFS